MTTLRGILIYGVVLSVGVLKAETVYELDVSAEAPEVKRGHLDLGGANANGESFAVNSFYIEKNGRPFIPVIGEFHYSRYPADAWEEELRKMKAGGINVVASYVFWNLHERKEGQFDWAGQLDLRRFVQLIDKVGLKAIVRVGPFGHGEMRNGALPDWVYGKPFEVRSNDPGYLALTNKLYAEIGQQLRGLLFKDGGPVIGVQLENEFQHSAAPWDIRYAGAPITRTVAERDVPVTHEGVSVSQSENTNQSYGRDHMRNLKQIAKQNGLEAPLYTATGWGNAAIVPKGSIPVTAAYPYPFWTPEATPSPFYLFKDIQRFPDYAPVSFDTSLYPSLPAELGSGISATYSRRSYVPEESVAPMIIRVLGSGSNGVGYYMYHGGATPVIDGHYYNEDASGLPKINYDYQAPLGQYGRAKEHYFTLRPLHLFLESYGDRLAPLPSILPPSNASIQPSNTHTLRYAARAARGSGFIFLLNFQDHVDLQDLKDLRLDLNDGRRHMRIPREGVFTLKKGVSAILPVNLDLAGAPLRSATVQPLAILNRAEGQRFIFSEIEGLRPELVFDRGEITEAENCRVSRENDGIVISGPEGQCFSFSVDGKPVLIVPAKMASQASRISDERLLFAQATTFNNAKEVTLLSFGATEQDIYVYPRVEQAPAVTGATLQSVSSPARALSAYRLSFAPVKFTASWQSVAPRRYAARFEQGLDGLHDVFMRVNYVGDSGMAFIDGEMVDDDLYFGRPWEIGLKRFISRLKGKEMVFVFQPMYSNATYIKDIPERFRPRFEAPDRPFLQVNGIEFVPEYRATLTFSQSTR